MYAFSRSLGRIEIPQLAPPQIQQLGWVPTDDQEAEQWAVQQAEAWAKPKVQRALGDAASRIQTELAHDIDLQPPMSDNETVNWTLDYLRNNGPPKNPRDAAVMMRRFLDDQGTTMGIHPAFVMATDLLVDFPLDDPGQALEWTASVGTAFLQQYGIPLTTDWDAKSMIMTSASAGLTQAGVPFAGAFTATASALWDGKVTSDEIGKLAGMVGSIVGATIGQMFGLPAPIGSFIGSVVTTLIFDGLGKLFGWGPSASSLRAQALFAARQAAEAERVKCIAMGNQVWGQYQKYWTELVRNVQDSINSQSFWLQHGLRFFEDAYVDDVRVQASRCPQNIPGILASALTGQTAPGQPCFLSLPATIDQACADENGCLYFGKYNQPPGLWVRDDERGWFGQEGNTHPDAIPKVHYEFAEKGAKIRGRLSARAALLFYGAYEFVTPYQAYRTFVVLQNYRQGASQLALLEPGGPQTSGMLRYMPFETQLQTDRTYIEALARVPIIPGNEFGGKYALGDCDTQRWAKQLFDSLLQCGPATALISRDISATIAAAVVNYKIQARSQQASVQQQAAEAAQTRRDLLRLRREKDRKTRALNGGLAAAGGGALAGWALSSILGR